MRILDIISGTRPNGAVLQCIASMRELIQNGHQITLVCRPGAWIAERLRDDKIEIIPSDLHRWPTDEVKRIARIAADRRFDVIHTHMSRGHSFGVLVRRFSGVPIVASAHCRRWHPQWPLNDLVIAHSHATARFLRRWKLVAADRLTVIPYLIDLDRFRHVPDDARRHVRQSLGIGDQHRLIGIVGDVSKRKGHIHAVRAMPEILRRVPDARLWIVGNQVPAYGERIRKVARQLGVAHRIIWSDYRDDIPEVMHAMDVCVSAALEEALGLTMPEAMAAGRPVIATRVGGLPENVEHGKNGLLVPPAHPASLADAVTTILGDASLAQQFGVEGRRRVYADYCRAREVARTEAVLESAMHQRQSVPRRFRPFEPKLAETWPPVSTRSVCS